MNQQMRIFPLSQEEKEKIKKICRENGITRIAFYTNAIKQAINSESTVTEETQK